MRTMTRARLSAGALLGVLLAVPLAGRAQAQNSVITGKVTTEFGQPLEGANVYISEMTISVGTNASGAYTITIPAARTTGQQIVLRVRAFGFLPQARPLRLTSGSQTADFAVKQDVNRLQEVVVTGVTAGTEQKNLAFTVAHVDDRDMPVASSNPLNQLQGKVPGAEIVSATGRPGAAQSVLLRGPKSINGSGRGQEPLYIVDGVELQGGLADVNPGDIETVEVVKGAAAASLYGSRAGNGVISITTKSGKNAGEGIRFNARSEYGRADIENEFPLPQNHFLMMDETKSKYCVATGGVNDQTCTRLVNLEDEAYRINDQGGDFALNPVTFARDGGIASTLSKPLLRGTFQVEQYQHVYNPVGQLVTPGQRTNSTIDASGRIGSTAFYGSLNNYWEQGALRYLNGYKRNSVRLNLDQNVGSAWQFGLRTYYSRNAADGGNAENGTGFFRLTRTPRGVDLLRTDSQGRLFIRSNPLNQGSQNDNPLYWFQNARQMDKNDRFIGTTTAKYIATSWLDFDGNFSYDRTNQTSVYQRDRGFRATSSSSTAPLGYYQYGTNNNQSLNSAVNANAHRSWGELNTRYTLRYLYEQQDFETSGFNGSSLAVPGLLTGDNIGGTPTVGSGYQSIRSVAVAGGIDADWKDRYIVGGLYRRDGSSLFGSANRWANYGRGSLAWRISGEPWWFISPINELKLRASVGTAGGRPRFDAQYETYAIQAGGQVAPSQLGNKKLRPETVTETEIGADAEVLSKYGLTVNYAKSTATDQILNVAVASIYGFPTQWRNIGTLENKTWEASLNVPLIQRRNLNWSARVNYDNTKSTITKLDVPPFFAGTGQQGTETMFRFGPGETYGTIYGRPFVTDCSQLEPQFAARCGSGKEWQKNSDGYVVWVGQGNTLADGITKNLWQSVNVGCVTAAGARIASGTINDEHTCTSKGNTLNAPWGVAENWGTAIVRRDTLGNALKLPLGHVLPDYRIGVSQTLNFRKLFFYTAFDGSIGQSVWNEGRHWSFGDFQDAEEDQGGKSVGDAKPVGYYWRAPRPDNGSGIGGFYDILGPNSASVEKASYVKLRELNVSYNVGPVRGMGDWTVSFTGRNLHTWTNYTGFDPEVGITNASNFTGSAALAAVDAFNFPNFRTFTFGLSTRF